ncbi:heme-binding protein [Streptomyces sp. NPDC006784]|uniref:GlcG/HbpS family heme-binding protein n=1 Tax=Streptomyces sp. NPDC006784 TaxID=3364764 RepID=UPI0036CFABEB
MQHKAKKFLTPAKVASCAAGLALVGAGTVGVLSASAQPPSAGAASAAPAAPKAKTTTTRHLTADAATDAARSALAAAEKEGRRVTVAVVDRNGNTLVTLRGDGAGPQSYESAGEKAYTAVSWNAPTSKLTERLESAPNLKNIPGTLFLPGGVPVTHRNTPIAGIGVAGAPSGEVDEKFARAGLAAISEHHRPISDRPRAGA